MNIITLHPRHAPGEGFMHFGAIMWCYTLDTKFNFPNFIANTEHCLLQLWHAARYHPRLPYSIQFLTASRDTHVFLLKKRRDVRDKAERVANMLGACWVQCCCNRRGILCSFAFRDNKNETTSVVLIIFSPQEVQSSVISKGREETYLSAHILIGFKVILFWKGKDNSFEVDCEHYLNFERLKEREASRKNDWKQNKQYILVAEITPVFMKKVIKIKNTPNNDQRKYQFRDQRSKTHGKQNVNALPSHPE